MKRLHLSTAFTRSMLDGHGLIGVIFGAVIYVLCLSGALVVMVDQLTIWERPQAPVVEAISPALLARVGQEGYRRARAAGVAHDLFVTTPTPELPHLTLAAFGEGGGEDNHRVWSVDSAGRFGAEMATPWVLFLQQLHFNLTVPGAIGRYLVGIFGTILLASLVTGILAHRRIFKDAFRLRWGGSRRLTNADLHNRIGVWALPFHLIVSLTGSLLGLSGLIIFVLALVAFRGDQSRAIASLLGPQPAQDARPAPLPDIRPMLARIEADTPGARVTQLRFDHAGTAGQQVTVSIAAPGHLTTAESFVFAPDGRLKHKAGFTDGNVGMRIYGMITPLHYGTYGGLPLKIIYALLGAGLTVIVASGGNIWLARRRDQGRPAARLERLWSGLVWGQPLVLALTALAELAQGGSALPVYWIATLGTWILALALRESAAVARALRLATGILLVLLPLLHGVRSGWGQPAAIGVDLALFAAGLAMLALGAGRRRRARVTVRGEMAAAE